MPSFMNAQFTLSLLHPRYWATWLGIALYYPVSLLPFSVHEYLARWLGALLMRINRKRVQVVRTNLGLCFPQHDDSQIAALTRAHFVHLMRGILHFGVVWWGSEKRLRKHLAFEGFEQVDQLRRQGRNVIVLLSHCTGLEMAVAAITMSFPCSGPYKPFKNPVIDWLVARARQRFACHTYTREAGFRPIVNDARQGRLVIYLADEDLGGELCEFAPFFNQPKATIPVLSKLARACRADVLPAIACYDIDSRRYRVRMFEMDPAFADATHQQSLQRMNTMIERTVLGCPAQYLWILKLFKTRPPGEVSLYP